MALSAVHILHHTKCQCWPLSVTGWQCWPFNITQDCSVGRFVSYIFYIIQSVSVGLSVSSASYEMTVWASLASVSFNIMQDGNAGLSLSIPNPAGVLYNALKLWLLLNIYKRKKVQNIAVHASFTARNLFLVKVISALLVHSPGFFENFPWVFPVLSEYVIIAGGC